MLYIFYVLCQVYFAEKVTTGTIENIYHKKAIKTEKPVGNTISICGVVIEDCVRRKRSGVWLDGTK